MIFRKQKNKEEIDPKVELTVETKNLLELERQKLRKKYENNIDNEMKNIEEKLIERQNILKEYPCLNKFKDIRMYVITDENVEEN